MSYWQVLMVNSGSSMLLTTNPTTTQAVCIRYTSALPAPRALQCWTQRHTKRRRAYIYTQEWYTIDLTRSWTRTQILVLPQYEAVPVMPLTAPRLLLTTCGLSLLVLLVWAVLLRTRLPVSMLLALGACSLVHALFQSSKAPD